MAFLTTRTDGTAQGTIDAHWYNDFLDALTGVQTDTAYELSYAPSPGGNPAVLTLVTNGNTHPLHLQNSGGTQLLDVDATGNVTVSNEWIWQRALGGSNQNIMNIGPTDAGTTNYILIYNQGNNHLFFWNGNTSTNLLDIDPSGDVTIPGNLTTAELLLASGYHIKTNGNASEYWTPQSGGSALGHVWITWNGSAKKTPFSVGGQFESAPAFIDNAGDLTVVNLTMSKITSDGGNFTSDGSGNVTANSFAGGGAGTTLPTTRNGTNTSVAVYTGTSTPSSPPTGSIWIKA